MDQLQVNGVFGLNLLTFQQLIGNLNALDANLFRQLCNSRCQFAIIYCLFAIRRAVKTNHHHVRFACGLQRAQGAERHFIILCEYGLHIRMGGSAGSA
ncbi:Uncharacterised protein [Pluralibacter gergoviae]|nr:Uncharacterised protein [Pluralibacter gergoviae]